MKRVASLLSIGFVVLGLELSARAVSLTFMRLSSGFQAILGGVELFVSPVRFLIGVGVLLVGLALALLLGWVRIAEGRVQAVGGVCPECREDTERLKRRAVQRLLTTFTRQQLTRRRWRGVWLVRALREVLREDPVAGISWRIATLEGRTHE